MPEVVAMLKSYPSALRSARTPGTLGHGLARVASASTVSSFCSVRMSLPSARVVSIVGRPLLARCSLTCARTSGSSAPAARTSSMDGSPAFLRSSSTTSTMNSKALPALSRT